MRDSFAKRGGVEYVESAGAYVQTYPEPVWEVFDSRNGTPLVVFATLAEAVAYVGAERIEGTEGSRFLDYAEAGQGW